MAPIPIRGQAVIRGTTADENGHITMEEEAFLGESLSLAMAARRNGGIVIAQVKRLHGFLDNMNAAPDPTRCPRRRESNGVPFPGGAQRARPRPAQLLQLTLARPRRSVASGRRVRRL
jgi:hypothetical protein